MNDEHKLNFYMRRDKEKTKALLKIMKLITDLNLESGWKETKK